MTENPFASPPLISVWQWQTAADDFVCIGLFTEGDEARRWAADNPNEIIFEGVALAKDHAMRKPAAVIEHATLESALEQIRRPTRDAALEEAALVIEGPIYKLVSPQIISMMELAVASIRVRKSDLPACGTCNGCGRDARDEGGRCQDCGGNGMPPGMIGIHPRAAELRARTEATLARRKEQFGDHPRGCDGMRSGVCTCQPHRPECLSHASGQVGDCDCGARG